jgi:prepilin-type N-terminal cleavage/methylation domain-containing protein
MRCKGMSLIELLVGLAVASMVAAIALTSLSMAGIASARQLSAARTHDSAWFALTAIARDLQRSQEWNGCIDSTTCTERASRRATSVLRLEHAMWFVEGALNRCPTDKPCEKYLDDVVAAEFIVDVPDRKGGLRHESLAKKHGARVRAIEVVLSTSDGRRYSRVTGRPEHAR